MKKIIGIILILIGFSFAVILKTGPTEETSFLFRYGDWTLIIAGLVCIIPGLFIYNKNR